MVLKLLLLIAIVLVVMHFRRLLRGTSSGRRRPPAPPIVMIACAECGVHLPRTDALADADGALYCTPTHRAAAQRRAAAARA